MDKECYEAAVQPYRKTDYKPIIIILDGQGTFNLEPCLLSLKYNLTNLKNDIHTLNELIYIMDGIKECYVFFFKS